MKPAVDALAAALPRDHVLAGRRAGAAARVRRRSAWLRRYVEQVDERVDRARRRTRSDLRRVVRRPDRDARSRRGIRSASRALILVSRRAAVAGSPTGASRSTCGRRGCCRRSSASPRCGCIRRSRAATTGVCRGIASRAAARRAARRRTCSRRRGWRGASRLLPIARLERRLARHRAPTLVVTGEAELDASCRSQLDARIPRADCRARGMRRCRAPVISG